MFDPAIDHLMCHARAWYAINNFDSPTGAMVDNAQVFLKDIEQFITTTEIEVPVMLNNSMVVQRQRALVHFQRMKLKYVPKMAMMLFFGAYAETAKRGEKIEMESEDSVLAMVITRQVGDVCVTHHKYAQDCQEAQNVLLVDVILNHVTLEDAYLVQENRQPGITGFSNWKVVD